MSFRSRQSCLRKVSCISVSWPVTLRPYSRGVGVVRTFFFWSLHAQHAKTPPSITYLPIENHLAYILSVHNFSENNRCSSTLLIHLARQSTDRKDAILHSH